MIPVPPGNKATQKDLEDIQGKVEFLHLSHTNSTRFSELRSHHVKRQGQATADVGPYLL